MGERDITPEREPHQPGPEEHPGEGGGYTDAARTRLKRRDPEGERVEDSHVPDESDPPDHQNDS